VVGRWRCGMTRTHAHACVANLRTTAGCACTSAVSRHVRCRRLPVRVCVCVCVCVCARVYVAAGFGVTDENPKVCSVCPQNSYNEGPLPGGDLPAGVLQAARRQRAAAAGAAAHAHRPRPPGAATAAANATVAVAGIAPQQLPNFQGTGINAVFYEPTFTPCTQCGPGCYTVEPGARSPKSCSECRLHAGVWGAHCCAVACACGRNCGVTWLSDALLCCCGAAIVCANTCSLRHQHGEPPGECACMLSCACLAGDRAAAGCEAAGVLCAHPHPCVPLALGARACPCSVCSPHPRRAPPPALAREWCHAGCTLLVPACKHMRCNHNPSLPARCWPPNQCADTVWCACVHVCACSCVDVCACAGALRRRRRHRRHPAPARAPVARPVCRWTPRA
jgi:hypothetical protein